MNNIVIKNISDITPFEADSNLSRAEKLKLINRYLNTKKYSVQGFLDRTNEAVLETHYHNVRDRRGRFARVNQN
jgi:hypothetical protein